MRLKLDLCYRERTLIRCLLSGPQKAFPLANQPEQCNEQARTAEQNEEEFSGAHKVMYIPLFAWHSLLEWQ